MIRRNGMWVERTERPRIYNVKKIERDREGEKKKTRGTHARERTRMISCYDNGAPIQLVVRFCTLRNVAWKNKTVT